LSVAVAVEAFVLGTVALLAFETTIVPLEPCEIRSPEVTAIDRVDDEVLVALADFADVVALAVVGTVATATVPVTTPLETAGAKIELPEIDGEVAAAEGTTVPLAGVAPTLIELVTAIVEAVVAVPAVVAVTIPFVTRAVLPLTVGVVAVVAGTTVPDAGVAPTPSAPVTARGEADAVDALLLPFDTPDTVAAPANTTPPPPPPPTPPVTARSPLGELTDGFTVDWGFTSIAGGTTAPPVG
jgi:hypothetical protein